MRNRWGVVAFAAVAVLTFSAVAHSQKVKVPVIQDGTPAVLTQSPAPRTPSGKPDLSGLWTTPSSDEEKILTARFGPHRSEPPSLTPWAAERLAYNTDTRPVPGYSGPAAPGSDPTKFLTSEGGGIYGGRIELNPIFKCFPPGLVYLVAGWQSAATQEVTQTDKRVEMIYEMDHTVRQIWTDGRKHPAEVDPTWMGHSVGTWDGDTLVVDTIGLLNGEREVWLDNEGHVASKGLHVVERYRRVDNDTLEIEFTLDDPKAFKKPWVRREYRRLRPKWELVEWQSRCYPGAPELKTNEENFNQIFTEPD
jgi:hypothetical protein